MSILSGIWKRIGTKFLNRQRQRARQTTQPLTARAGIRLFHLEQLEDRTLLSISGTGPIELLDVSLGSYVENYGRWLDFDINDDLGLGASANIELTESSQDGVSGQISIPGAWLQSVTLGDMEFTRLTIPGCGYSNVIGAPQLPMVRSLLVMPEGVNGNAAIDGQSQLLSLLDVGMNHNLAPVQAPVVKLPGELETAPLDFNQTVYQTDQFAPQAGIRL